MTERVRAGQIVRIDACAELRYAKLGEREYRDRIRKRFSQLVPVKEVKHEIELPGAHYFGIHIRYTDHLPAHIATPRCCYDWLIGFLKEEFPTTPLWICGDTPSFVQRLQRIAPEQIRVSQTVRRLVIPARNSIEDIRHALAELITLSQADLVFGSPFSSFSKFASTLGAANLVPIVVHPFFCLRAIEPILWALQRGHDRSASKKDFFPVFATRWAMRNAVRSFARLLMHPTVQDHSWLPDPSFSAHHLRSELPREYDEASQQKLV